MPCSRVAAGISNGPFQLTNRPAATVANTPDPPTCSGTQNVTFGEIGYGIGIGWLSLRLRRWARDPRVEITLSLMTPGPKDEADRERHAEQPMDGESDRTGGEHDTAESQQRDRAQVEPELAPAHGDPGRVDEWRQDAE